MAGFEADEDVRKLRNDLGLGQCQYGIDDPVGTAGRPPLRLPAKMKWPYDNSGCIGR